MKRISPTKEEENIVSFFHSSTYITLKIDDIEQQLEQGYSKIISSFEKFIERGSGWLLDSIHHMELKTAKYNPLRGNSFLPLPKALQKKKAILNIENFDDDKCLLWCLIAHKLNLDYTEHAKRVENYSPYEKDVNMDGVTFPVPYQKIPDKA